MQQRYQLYFTILASCFLIIFIALAFMLGEKRKNDTRLHLISTATLINSRAGIALQNIQYTKTNKEQIENIIKPIFNPILEQNMDFAFYYLGFVNKGMFIPFIVGRNREHPMFIINALDFSSSTTQTSLFYKGDYIFFYKKIALKNSNVFSFIAFKRPAATMIYVYVISIALVMIILFFIIFYFAFIILHPVTIRPKKKVMPKNSSLRGWQKNKNTLIIVFLLIMSSSSVTNSKVGVGYYFNNKRVVKKFYNKDFIQNTNKEMLLYKSALVLFKDNKDFIVKSSSKDKNVFLKKRTVKGYNILPLKRRTMNVRAAFKKRFNRFVDIYPKKAITLPRWTKSIDFWARELISTDISISLFFIHPDGKEVEHKLAIPNSKNKWHKIYINLIHKRKLNTRPHWKKSIILTKIRVSKGDRQPNSTMALSTTAFRAYNYIKTTANLYKNPTNTLETFEEDALVYIKAADDNKTNMHIEQHTDNAFLSTGNNTYLALNIQNHNNRPTLIYFPEYKLAIEHNISLWIKGLRNKEQVSLIFEEAKHRYFELALKEVYFEGWKQIYSSIPRDKITYFKNEFGMRYIKVIGLKISPSLIDKPISIGVDALEGIIRDTLLGDIQTL